MGPPYSAPLVDTWYDIMTDAYARNASPGSLFEALIAASRQHRRCSIVVQDGQQSLSYSDLLKRSLLLGRALTAYTRQGDNVGVLLLNTIAAVEVFFSLQAYARIPVMLNIKGGAAALDAACTMAQITTICTSKALIEKAELEGFVIALEDQGIAVVFVEELQQRLGLMQKLWLSVESWLPSLCLKRRQGDIGLDAPAVVLMTSGSEGAPKGVVLSHGNLISNCRQIAQCLSFDKDDLIFNALPASHAFGLTAGILLPLLHGFGTFLFPLPLAFEKIPELIEASGSTLLFSTDTLLTGYARAARKQDVAHLRYVYAGAERLRENTRQLWLDRFGIDVLQGYGVTETAPALALNTPEHHKPGTVGRLLDGVAHKLEPVPGVKTGGCLCVKGPNVMLGYLTVEQPGVLKKPPHGWHNTGDVVSIDDEGYVTICGRAKRFAKVAGEMISLAAVEAVLQQVLPHQMSVVINVPHARRGEMLVWVADSKEAELKRSVLAANFKKAGLPNLAIPKSIVVLEVMPLLASGKVDYARLKAAIVSQLDA